MSEDDRIEKEALKRYGHPVTSIEMMEFADLKIAIRAERARLKTQRAVALALVSGHWDGPAGDYIKQEIWDELYEDKMLAPAGDETGETWPSITRAGEDELIQILRKT